MSENVRPMVLNPGTFAEEDLAKLKDEQSPEVIDIYEHQLAELFRITNPSAEVSGSAYDEFCQQKGTGEMAGAWAYYPWDNKLLHCLGPEDLFALRTNRNKQLVTAEEQQRLANAVVGVTGMSVGGGIVTGLTYSGISRRIKIADHDTLDTSNLNRLKEPLRAVGQPKVDLAAQHVYELDPFSQVDVFPGGIDDTNIDEFFSEPALNLVIDEIDDFKMKVKLRLQAKKSKIPLLMFTSLGDNILVDVERYDLEPDAKIFNGQLGSLEEEILEKTEISDEDAKRYAVQLVGQEYVPTRAMGSLLEMGKTLVGRPQLFSTIAVDGGLAAYAVRRILINGDIASGRYFIKFSQLFGLQPGDLEHTDERDKILETLLGKKP